MPSRIGKNFIKALTSDPKKCAEKYKIINTRDIECLDKFKDLWMDPEKEIGISVDDVNEITINNDKYGYTLKISTRYYIYILASITID